MRGLLFHPELCPQFVKLIAGKHKSQIHGKIRIILYLRLFKFPQIKTARFNKLFIKKLKLFLAAFMVNLYAGFDSGEISAQNDFDFSPCKAA